MEKDDEVKGVGNSLNFGSRTIYDPRLGRFNSVDPRARQYPSMSPYVYASDNPLYYNDEDGEGPIPFRLKDLLTENSSYLTGLLAGIGDGIIETIDLVAGMAQTSNAFNPIFNPIFFFSDEAKKIRSEAMETAKMALNALTNEDLRNKIWTNIKKEFGEWLDQTTFQGTAAEAGYQHGKLIFDGLTALVGVSEVKYLLKTGEFSLSGKKLLGVWKKAKKSFKTAALNELKNFLKLNAGESIDVIKKRLKSSIKSHTKQIEKHKKWLINPKLKYGDKWDKFSEQHKKNIIHHWKEDIRRNKEYKKVKEQALKELNN